MNTPFSAFVGADDAKLALILNLINPKIGGLLIRGDIGTGKTTLLSSLGDVFHCPCHIKTENLLGSIDFEQSLRTGKYIYQPALLAKIKGKPLLLDGLHLFNRAVINTILKSQERGFYQVEREGYSAKIATEFILLASLNPAESLLDSSVIQSFGMIVDLPKIENLEQRLAIIKNTYLSDEKIKTYQRRDKTLLNKISLARTKLTAVELSFAMQLKIAEAVNHFKMEGNFLELRVYQTCLALAAFHEREVVSDEDLETALRLVLRNRQSRDDEQYALPPEFDNDSDSDDDFGDEENQSKDNTSENGEQNNSQDPDNTEADVPENDNSLNDYPDLDQELNSSQEVKKEIIGKGMKLEIPSQRSYLREQILGSGKREKRLSFDGRGHTIYYRQTNKYQDIDIFGTLLKAAPKQVLRGQNNNEADKIIIKKDDLQRKIREQRIGFSLVLLIDASGSLHAKKRMQMLKGTVFNLLSEAYVKRDKIALISFRKGDTSLTLPLTNSVYLAQQRLESLESGGNSPLAMGLDFTYNYINMMKIKQKNSKFILILMSDGRTNVSETGISPVEETLCSAQKLAMLDCKKIFVDYEQGRIKLGLMEKFAERAGAEYRKVDNLNSEYLETEIKKSIYGE